MKLLCTCFCIGPMYKINIHTHSTAQKQEVPFFTHHYNYLSRTTTFVRRTSPITVDKTEVLDPLSQISLGYLSKSKSLWEFQEFSADFNTFPSGIPAKKNPRSCEFSVAAHVSQNASLLFLTLTLSKDLFFPLILSNSFDYISSRSLRI